MKKALFSIITAILCVTILLGCTQNIAQDDIQEKFCRVVCVKENGIIVWIEGLEYVYVEHVNADIGIGVFDTVVMKFSESDLMPANETFQNFDGSELRYSYILEEPNGIRFPDTTKGEPTLG